MYIMYSRFIATHATTQPTLISHKMNDSQIRALSHTWESIGPKYGNTFLGVCYMFNNFIHTDVHIYETITGYIIFLMKPMHEIRYFTTPDTDEDDEDDDESFHIYLDYLDHEILKIGIGITSDAFAFDDTKNELLYHGSMLDSYRFGEITFPDTETYLRIKHSIPFDGLLK
jgi:hypothetical protein